MQNSTVHYNRATESEASVPLERAYRVLIGRVFLMLSFSSRVFATQ